MNKRRLGLDMEEKALRYLELQGLQCVCRNYCKREGEIDLIMREGKILVFIEVKYRKDLTFGYPYEAINHRKQRTIRKVAAIFLSEHEEYVSFSKRFDYLGILGDVITWVKDAF